MKKVTEPARDKYALSAVTVEFISREQEKTFLQYSWNENKTVTRNTLAIIAILASSFFIRDVLEVNNHETIYLLLALRLVVIGIILFSVVYIHRAKAYFRQYPNLLLINQVLFSLAVCLLAIIRHMPIAYLGVNTILLTLIYYQFMNNKFSYTVASAVFLSLSALATAVFFLHINYSDFIASMLFLVPVNLLGIMILHSINRNRRKRFISIVELKQSNDEKNAALNQIIQQSNDQKELLHILCHDLANPLANVSSLLGMAVRKNFHFEELYSMMQVSVDNGLATIDLVREMSELDEKTDSLDICKSNLLQLVNQSNTMLSRKIEEKNIELVTDIDVQHEVLVERISFVNSVLNNLLSNAIKFSFPQTKIFMTSRPANGFIRLSIKDQGIGMPPGLIRDLFDFSRATSREGTKGEKGTGFGMPLVKKFVEAYRGKIEIKSTEKTESSTDHGTEIILNLRAA